MSLVHDFQERITTLAGVAVHIMSYQFEGIYFCYVKNLDPGATIARAQAPTQQKAEQMATDKATHLLEKHKNT